MANEVPQFGVPYELGSGGQFINPGVYPGQNVRDLLIDVRSRVWTPQTGIAGLQAILPANRQTGTVVFVAGQEWQYSATSVAADATNQLVVVPSDIAASAAYLSNPATAPGRWLLCSGSTIDLVLPFTYATADATYLFTFPVNSRLAVVRGYWEITTGCTGGSSSAIGASSNNANWNTKGDLLGGAAGDVAATLVVGNPIMGTLGAKIAAKPFLSGIGGTPDKIRFDRIASAFTAGAGNIHIIGELVANPGV